MAAPATGAGLGARGRLLASYSFSEQVSWRSVFCFVSPRFLKMNKLDRFLRFPGVFKKLLSALQWGYSYAAWAFGGVGRRVWRVRCGPGVMRGDITKQQQDRPCPCARTPARSTAAAVAHGVRHGALAPHDARTRTRAAQGNMGDSPAYRTIRLASRGGDYKSAVYWNNTRNTCEP